MPAMYALHGTWQMLLIILMLLVLIGSFGLLAGLVYFSETVIESPPAA
jgi:hypothetical protein